jgi:membrane protease YdiL (CAAX protease family)
MKRATFLMYGILPALVMQLVGAYCYFVLFADSEMARMIYGLTKLLMSVWPLGWLWAGAPLKVPRFELPQMSSIIKGLSTGLFGAAMIGGVYFLWPQIIEHATSAVSERATNLGVASWFVSFAIVFSLAHSLFEEYYWRWFVNGGLKLTFSPFAAAVIGSFGFTSHHLIILSMFFSPAITAIFGGAIFAAGVVWSLMAKNIQGLWSAWLSHAIIDGAIFLVISTFVL